MSRAVGIRVGEGYRARAVRVKGGGAVGEDRDDGVAADIGDGRDCRAMRIHQTRHGRAAVRRNVGDGLRQGDVEGERPCGIDTRTILVSIGKGLCACAICDIALHCWSCRNQRVTAGIGDRRKCNGISSCLAFAVHGVSCCHLTNRERGRSVNQDILRNSGAVAAEVSDGIGTE